MPIACLPKTFVFFVFTVSNKGLFIYLYSSINLLHSSLFQRRFSTVLAPKPAVLKKEWREDWFFSSIVALGQLPQCLQLYLFFKLILAKECSNQHCADQKVSGWLLLNDPQQNVLPRHQIQAMVQRRIRLCLPVLPCRRGQ